VKERLAATVLLDVTPAMTSQLAGGTARRAVHTTMGSSAHETGEAAASAVPSRVLLAASDERLAAVLKRGLEVENYVVDRVEHGRAALDRSVENEPGYKLLLLDALLEYQSGFDVCRELRRRDLDVPIILLGSRQSVEDKIDALHVGADDYLCQTNIVLEELLAKMEALLR
jgi:DNA-binding response OmpR family regulator